MNPDPHEVLGIERGTPPAAVRARYRKLARQYHPDVNGQDATAEWVFKHIQAAYAEMGRRHEQEQSGQALRRTEQQKTQEDARAKREPDPQQRRNGQPEPDPGKRDEQEEPPSPGLFDGVFGWGFAACGATMATPPIAAGVNADHGTTFAIWLVGTAVIRGLMRMLPE